MKLKFAVVHDATGSVIIGAKATITDVATNISSAATTDGRGYYIFNSLHPGTYNLKAEMAGFRAEEMQNVVLAVSQRTNIELTLNVAGLEQQMTIVEAAPTLETGGSAIGTTVGIRFAVPTVQRALGLVLMIADIKLIGVY